MCKDQESIQSSTTPDQGYQWKKINICFENVNMIRNNHSFCVTVSPMNNCSQSFDDTNKQRPWLLCGLNKI